MQLALYKGNVHLIDRLVAFWSGGSYSHCEILFSDGLCASSSRQDGGVRIKYVKFITGYWDFVDLPGNEEAVRQWFESHSGEGYDYLGLAGFVIRPVRGPKGRWLCSEAIMEALGYKETWRFCPNSIAALFKKDNHVSESPNVVLPLRIRHNKALRKLRVNRLPRSRNRSRALDDRLGSYRPGSP